MCKVGLARLQITDHAGAQRVTQGKDDPAFWGSDDARSLPIASVLKTMLALCGAPPDADIMQTQLIIATNGPGLYEFTHQVADWAKGTGLLTLFVQHTSASLVIQENADPEVQVDLQNFFARLVPPTTDPSMAYLTHTYEGPDDMPAHIKAAMLPTQLSIPVTDGRLALGTWQGIYLFEHRDRPHQRRVIAHLG